MQKSDNYFAYKKGEYAIMDGNKYKIVGVEKMAHNKETIGLVLSKIDE